MPNLPENITYKSLRGAIAPMIKTSQEIGRSLPQPKKSKRVDISGFKNLMSQMSNFNTAQSTPATVGNLGTVTTPYMGSTKIEAQHPGLDIANKMGTPIPAFSGGTVVGKREGMVQGSPDFGNYILIQDDQGNKFRYSHLKQGLVSIGDIVQSGQIIGQMGNTGQTYSTSGGDASHLDIRIQNLWGKYLNPAAYISS